MDYLIVGLGNPGPDYEQTRHNIGWMALQHFAEKNGTQIKRLKYKSLCAETTINGKKVLLMLPQTLMNASGIAVREAADFYKVPLDHILVFCDDINLPTGQLRIRVNGSAGGHNGLKSIIRMMDGDTFPRIRIGVSDRANPNVSLGDWVLGRFSKEELKALTARFDDIADAAELIMNGKTEDAMCRYNRKIAD